MKVVLLKDVVNIGRKHDVKSVSDGYALNFLIPKTLAEIGTAQAIGRAWTSMNCSTIARASSMPCARTATPAG